MDVKQTEARKRLAFVFRFLGSLYGALILALITGLMAEKYYPHTPLWLWPVVACIATVGVVSGVWATYVYLKRND